MYVLFEKLPCHVEKISEHVDDPIWYLLIGYSPWWVIIAENEGNAHIRMLQLHRKICSTMAEEPFYFGTSDDTIYEITTYLVSWGICSGIGCCWYIFSSSSGALLWYDRTSIATLYFCSDRLILSYNYQQRQNIKLKLHSLHYNSVTYF